MTASVHPTPIAEWVDRTRAGIRAGRFPARAFNDQEVHDLEQRQLFARAWCFLAHETEIPQPGDYVTRYIGNNNLIVARDEHGVVHASLNMCRHRGNVMCKAEMGNASHFRCSYHGWTYKNSGELIGVPYMKEGYEGRLRRKDWALVGVRVESYGGLLFGCLDILGVRLQKFDIHISQYFFDAIPYLATIFILLFAALGKRKRRGTPAALGQAYFREER